MEKKKARGGCRIPARGGAEALEKHDFNLKYAPHFGMFREHAGDDLIDQLKFMADTGFRAFEDNMLKSRPRRTQERIGSRLAASGMEMGVFVAHTIDWNEPTLTSGDRDKTERFLKEIRSSAEVARRAGARWMTVVPGRADPRLEPDYQELNLIEALKRAAEILHPHGLVVVIEPLNTIRNHPGMFLTRTPQAYRIAKAVGSPSCKILYDAYHQSVTEGNIISGLEKAMDEIPYIQVGDNPGRNEPGTGEINYRNVFKFLQGKKFGGIIGMEHGKSARGRKGEIKLIRAYLEADGFSG